MLQTKYKNLKANIIREKLLIFSNEELQINKKNNRNNFLINSKPLESYEKKYDNYIIIEHYSFIHLKDENNKLQNKDDSPDSFFQHNQFKDPSPILLKTKKMRLTKHPDKIHPRKLSDSIELTIRRSQSKNKIIENNIKYLRNLSKNFKSTKIKKIIPQRNYSEKLRKKKIHNNLNSYICNDKNEETKESIEEEDCIIKLHKMWKSHKKKYYTKKTSRKQLIKIMNNHNYMETEVYSMREPENLFLVFGN